MVDSTGNHVNQKSTTHQILEWNLSPYDRMNIGRVADSQTEILPVDTECFRITAWQHYAAVENINRHYSQ